MDGWIDGYLSVDGSVGDTRWALIFFGLVHGFIDRVGFLID